ncbi:hypothetical protein [Bacillus swezeyi]|uniref:hypothetical protein n=1 Tax=Bacillus swezeyi TaxID=1925020 RepID=UPI0012389349|nr:hypothetical protein [Bacillus swezeyi]KAA6472271.1 hypothetical protein DX928_22885 [Bacillus swezeyi]
MDAEMRHKPILTGEDAERFLEKVRRNNRKIEARISQRKKLNVEATSSPFQSLKQSLKEMKVMREGKLEKLTYEEMKQQMKKEVIEGRL